MVAFWFLSRFRKRERQGKRGKGRRADQTCRTTQDVHRVDEDEGDEDENADQTCRTKRTASR